MGHVAVAAAHAQQLLHLMAWAISGCRICRLAFLPPPKKTCHKLG